MRVLSMSLIRSTSPVSRKTSREIIEAWLVRELADRLGLPPGRIDSGERFHRYGLDSARAAGLIAALASELERPLPPTLVWDYPTVASLAAHLCGEEERTTRTPLQPSSVDEPIAVVGIACRFPQAADSQAFWRLLSAEVDAVGDAPADRWDVAGLFDRDATAPGKMNTRWGGFLDDVAGFDAAFFGIAPREATQMDPQQRLGLELAWEVLEDAGIPTVSLRASRTSVFVGAMWNDYAALAGGLAAIAPHTATGRDTSIIAARISYLLGLEGPSVTLNTACSSSLVAVHLACQSLRSGESTLALAGGVNLILAPDSTVAMTKFGAMSPDGRCRAFDAGANGYVRGEGGGLVALKPLAHAIRDGDRIYCVIRGSAANNDGMSNGLTAPNPRAQEAVLHDACDRAGVAAADVDYVEAHGTGTMLGDPIEAGALGAVMGPGRLRERPLLVGSVKTNIGHLEAAAGIAGLIKTALALHHGEIPASLHFERPNPHIAFDALGLAVVGRRTAWPARARPAIAGVSSFGFGGTNCHVVLQARAMDSIRPVFVFSGNGSQWLGMGRTLLRSEPVFRDAIARSDHALENLSLSTGWSIAGELEATPERSRLHDVAVGQPVLFALQVALAEWWQARGVVAAAVVGHSVGEVAAAHVAGILSLSDALRVVVQRSRLQARSAGHGAMALVRLTVDETAREAAAHGSELCIACHNGPRATVVSGNAAAVTAFIDDLRRRGIEIHPIAVDVAYHSPHMDDARAALVAALDGLRPGPGRIAMVSTVSAQEIRGEELDAAYWGRNLREAVLFTEAVTGLAREGHRQFLELSPHAIVTPAVAETLLHAGVSGTAVGSLRRGTGDHDALALAAATLSGGGAKVEPSSVAGVERSHHLLTLSARSDAALRELAARYALSDDVSLADLSYSANTRRDHLPHRLALVATTIAEARTSLAAFAHGDAASGISHGVIEGGRVPRAAFLFARQGWPHAEMGRQMYRTQPTFKAVIDRCAAVLAPLVDWSLTSVLFEPGDGLDRADVAGPALFALEVALASVWRSWGVEPAAVMGEGVGEYAAACVASAITIEEGLSLSMWHRPLDGASGDGVADHSGTPRIPMVTMREGIEGLRAIGCDAFLDVGPHPVLTGMDVDGSLWLPSLERGRDEWLRMLASLASLYVRGAPVDFAGFDRDYARTRVPLPHYPWQRERYWITDGIEPERAQDRWECPAPRVVADAVAPGLTDLQGEGQLAAYETIEGDLEALSAIYAARALRDLGWDGQPDAGSRLPVAPRHRRFAARLIDMAGDADSDPAALAARCLDSQEGTYLVRCGERLADVLREVCDPLQLLFPGGALDEAALFYRDAPFFATGNLMLREAVAAVAASVPANGRLRVLEVGAGTGATTSRLLPLLPADRTDYVFTDLSPLFLTEAQRKFASYPFLRTARLDVEAPPQLVALGGSTFDLVVAVNVLHATTDLRRTLRHMAKLLHDGGLLVLLEVTSPPAWLDVVAGGIEGWSKYTDVTLRPSHALLTPDAWRETLTTCGWEDPQLLSDGGRHSLILARATRAAASSAVEPAAPVEGRDALVALVRREVADTLGIAPDRIDPRRGFFEMGMDSLLAVGLRQRLEHLTGRPVHATALFAYPSVEALAAWLGGESIAPRQGSGAASRSDEPIAVIGVGCRFPGGVDDIASFARLLYDGIDAVTEVPADRWDASAWYDADPDAAGRIATRWGAFIPDVDLFDAALFGIAPREAVHVDPQQRLLMEVAWEALENAGLAPDALAGTPTGVFVGITSNDYAELVRRSGDVHGLGTYTLTGQPHNTASGRLSYVLGLRGPSLSVDTACSSSLVAVHLACQALQSGECRTALAGGVNLILSPEGSVILSRAHMMAPDGRCKVFDAAADGFVRGEGCAIVVCKRLADAVADGDRIMAVIRGSAVNHDGRSSGFTVPSGPAQEDVIRHALARAGVAPSAVSYVEAHGTGTALGDPIEVQALAAAYGEDRSSALVLGSVKANIGHLEPAAGIAGLLKVIVSLERHSIPPQLHFQTLNPHIAAASFPIVIPTAALPWDADGGRRIAGVSSFGASGTNAHVVLEEPPPPVAPHAATRPLHLLCLSGADEAALRAQAARMAAFLARADVDLADACYTANSGRARLAHRLALVAADRAEAVALLEKFVAGAESSELHVGEISLQKPAPPDAAIEQALPDLSDPAAWRTVLSEMARRFVSGASVDLRALEGEVRRRKIALPVYAFQRRRYWLPGAPATAPEAAAAKAHVLCGERIRSASRREKIFELELSLTRQPFLADHRIDGVPVVPATVYLEMILATVAAALPDASHDIVDLELLAPLVLPEEGACVCQIVITPSGEIEILGADTEAPDGWRTHVRARAVSHEGSAAPVDLEALARRCERVVAGFDGRLAARGFAFGPAFKTLHEVWHGADEAVGRIDAPADGGFRVHPGTVDGALQILSSLLPEEGAFLPAAVASYRVQRSSAASVPHTLWGHATVRTQSPDGVKGDVVLYDADGCVVAEVLGLVLRRAQMRQPSVRRDIGYDVIWREAMAVAADTSGSTFAVVGGEDGMAAEIEKLLSSSGAPCATAVDVASIPDDARAVVDLRGVRDDGDVERMCGELVELVQVLTARSSPPSLWLVTIGGEAVGCEAPSAAQAALRGLARVIALEHPELACMRIDLDPSAAPGEQAAAVVRELLASADDSREDQVAIRGGERYVPRLARIAAASESTGPRGLVLARQGTLDGLELATATRRAPGSGEVEIRVAATGLNFRDVLNALGRYPGDAGPLGIECAGDIAAVGAGVTAFAVGDPVVALAPGAFSPFVTVSADLVAPRPAAMTAEEAATIPVAFLTAWYGLHHLARLAPWDRVLIHAAAGGVGMAAIQIARRAGATVLATASRGKWGLVRSLGVDHVMDSRATGFARAVAAATDGHGVDVVLNSLAGDAIGEGLDSLAPRGRFLEIGKTDAWDAARVMHQRPDVAYLPYDVGEACAADPSLFRSAMTAIFQAIDAGTLAPLPRRLVSVARAPEAFRAMAKGRHTGKIVVVHETPVAVRRDASYVVTGGLGGVGRRVGLWLAARGAGHIVLAGRRPPTDAALASVKAMEESGARVTVWSVDVSQRDQLAAALATLTDLRGVIHAAGIVDDGVLRALDGARLSRVLAGKAIGARHLDELTAHVPLDFFVLFSSAASLLGSAGQGNYAAANAFLDALAHARRARGLAACAINWGAWAGDGMVAALPDAERARVAARGYRPVVPGQALAALDQALADGAVQRAVMDVDWDALIPPGASVPPFVSDVVRRQPRPQDDVLDRLRAAYPGARRALLQGHVRRSACRVLGLDEEQPLDPRRPLRDIGLDSLMSVELCNALAASLQCGLPSTVLFDHPSVEALSIHLATLVTELGTPPLTASTTPGLDTLTADELRDLLEKELAAAGFSTSDGEERVGP
jgi:acyl transferase domain-containing protein/acyl carrier protein/predicted O-methyltransferase YrrM